MSNNYLTFSNKPSFFPIFAEKEVKRITNSKNEHLILTEGKGLFKDERVLSLYKANNISDNFMISDKVSSKTYIKNNKILWRNKNGENAMVSKNSIPTRLDNTRRNYYFDVECKSLKAIFSRHSKNSPLVAQNFNLVESAKILYPKAQRALKLMQKIAK